MTSQFSESEQPIPSVENKQAAKAAYFGYAALVGLDKEAIEHGAALIDTASFEQTEKLRTAFASVVHTMMEMEGLVTVKKERRELIESSEELVAETLMRPLPSPVRRYLAKLVGPVDDLELTTEHIPIIMEVLFSYRGDPEVVTRRTLNIEAIIRMRLSGMQRVDIAQELGTIDGRVKGAILRFDTAIKENATPEVIGAALRDRLAEEALLKQSTRLTKDEIEASLPPRAPQKTYPTKKRSSNTRQFAEMKNTDKQSNSNGYLQNTPFSDHQLPDDLLPDETMAERRMRLQAEAAAKANGADA